MPADRIIGVAVLNWRHGDRFGWLHFVGECADGRRFIHHIPVYPEGLSRPEKDGGWWKFKGDSSDVIQCTPSVQISGHIEEFGPIVFHNNREWSVRHVLFHDASQPWVENWPPELLKKINVDLLRGHRVGNY